MAHLWPSAAALLALLPHVLVGFFTGDGCGDGCDCVSCTICSSCTFTEVAGTWVNTAGTITTSSASGIYLSDTPQPGGGPGLQVVCAFTPSANGDQMRILADYVDANNFLFLEATAGASGTLKIWRKSGGIDTLIKSKTGVSIPAATATTVTLCITADGVAASAYTGAFVSDFSAVVNATNPGWGLGTGATLAGSVTFVVSTGSPPKRTDNNCGGCAVTCSVCKNGIISGEYQVTIPFAFSANTCTGPQCAAVGGTYYIPMSPSLCEGDVCTQLDLPCVGSVDVSVTFVSAGGGTGAAVIIWLKNYTLDGQSPGCPDAGGEPGQFSVTWIKTYTFAHAGVPDVDCTKFSNEVCGWADLLASYGVHYIHNTCNVDTTQNATISSA